MKKLKIQKQSKQTTQLTRRDEIGVLKDGQNDALPEGEKDDRLDGEELPDGIVGREEVSRGVVEEDQSVEGQADADVVDHDDVEVARVGAPVAVAVLAEGLQNERGKGHDRLDGAELQRRLLAEAQKANRVGAPAQAAGAVGPAGANWLPPNLRHDVPLAAQVLIAEAEEVVDDKGCIG